VRAAGRWAWWNQYGTVPLAKCVERAKAAGLNGIIVKHGFRDALLSFQRAGLVWATERYVFPDQPELEARRLADDIREGASFAVVNAEVEWENLGRTPMERLVREYRRLQPRAELYASVDTRGNRTALPYQRVLADHVSGWMPMVYPAMFRPQRPAGFVRQAFADCLDGKDFRGKPVLPTLQAFNRIGPVALRAQIEETNRRELAGYQLYTIGHATDEEWEVIVEQDNAEAIENVRRDFRRFAWEHAVNHAVAVLFLRAAGHALRSEPIPESLKDELRRVVR
jgi:hypothetical protein